MKPIAALLLLCALSLPHGILAQRAAALAALEEGVRLAQDGDTIRALGHIERAVTIDPGYAEAHFLKGLYHARQAPRGTGDFRRRIIAREALDLAVRHDPENPLYLLELARLLMMQEIRVDARRMLRRALDVAERADAPTLAEVHYQLGIFSETTWRRLRYRRLLPIGIAELRGDIAFESANYVWDALQASGYAPGQGAAAREAMLDHFHRALTADPAHTGAATHLLAFYYDTGRMAEFMAEAQRFVRAAPSEPRAYLAFGLGLHAEGRDDEAAGAFEYAVELLPEETRADFMAVSRLLTQDDAEIFEARVGADPADAARRFWTAWDPLYLTPSNEYWAEYLSRMAYVDLRFGLPEYDVPGWRTDRGDIWVRYGRPLRQASFGANTTAGGDMESVGRVTTVWSYGRNGPVFVFRGMPGYRGATFANGFRFYAENYRARQPARFAAPSLPALLQVPAQVARFRGVDGEIDLEVYAAVPLDSLRDAVGVAAATFETGLFVVEPDGAEIRRVTEAREVTFEAGRALPMSWRTTVPAGQPHIVSAEARDPLSWAAAVHRARVDARSFPAGELSVSDILLTRSLEVVTDPPRTRTDFRMVPEPTLTYAPDDEIGVYFELYNLLPDSDRFASYDLELAVTVEEIHRTGSFVQLLGELADRWGLTAEGDQAVRLTFSKQNRVLARDMLPEYFTIQLDEPPPGRYGLRLRVLDRNARLQLEVEREFQVREP